MFVFGQETHFELNHCECGHGAARHSDKPSGDRKNFGFLCLEPSCPCYNLKPCNDCQSAEAL